MIRWLFDRDGSSCVVRPATWLAVMLFLAAPTPVYGHLVSLGAGPFFDGVAHFLVSPEDLLAVVALAFWSGLASKPAARRLTLALPLAWLCGVVVGQAFAERGWTRDWMAAVTQLGAGLLLAVCPRLPPRVVVAVAVVIGGVHGALNGGAMAATQTSYEAGLGILVAVAVVTLLVSAAATSLSKPWQRIAVRVAGSWFAAIGLLSLAWHFRPNA